MTAPNRRQSPRRIVRLPISGALLDLDSYAAWLAGWAADERARTPEVRRLSAAMPEFQLAGRPTQPLPPSRVVPNAHSPLPSGSPMSAGERSQPPGRG